MIDTIEEVYLGLQKRGRGAVKFAVLSVEVSDHLHTGAISTTCARRLLNGMFGLLHRVNFFLLSVPIPKFGRQAESISMVVDTKLKASKLKLKAQS